MSEKVLGMQCQKCHNIIPLTIEHDIYCPNCNALMVVANLVVINKEEERWATRKSSNCSPY